MRIPRTLRDLQVERESLFLDFSFQRLFHGLGLFFCQWRQQLSFCAVVSDTVSCDHDGQCGVHVLVDDRLASSQSRSPFGALDLYDKVVEGDGVIPINSALISLSEDHFEVPVSAGYEGGAALCCRNRKTPIELGNVMVVEKLIGSFQCSDPAQA